MATEQWGHGLSQADLMEKDSVIVVDNRDNITGSASKKESHVFSTKQPHGILHRAFSVFIFDESDGSLLIHQRSSDKITFPNVWTNTCCSHPLHGMTPSEVDTPADVSDASVPGVKNAAVRKLLHELGIENADPKKMKFLTRLHYWAADTVTHGSKSPWGEHEVDYVLFYTVPHKDSLSVSPNKEEIRDVKWVSSAELQTMLEDKNLLFSPWFRLIYYKWLRDCWWKDLKVTMSTDKWVDVEGIHEFEPPKEHFGGAGDARQLFASFEKAQKQGSYGKVKIHKEGTLAQLCHLDELFSALKLLYLSPLKSNIDDTFIKSTFGKEELSFCDEILVKVSRSFAAVIRQLPSVVLVDIMVFYLVLRALDTIEDDTSAFESHQAKIEQLIHFHERALQDPNWSLSGVGDGDERRLLENFPMCHKVYAKLRPKSRDVIADITKRMAAGMAEFVEKDLGQGTVDIVQYNRYCHFVAGLVGEGLSRLFVECGLEGESIAKELKLADQMGLFLQKTNIIRDYLEDYVDKRAFWPQIVWKRYSVTGELGYFTNQDDPVVRQRSLSCLNELVTDALELVPDCLEYLSRLQCLEIFRFCAIPQVMAIATLEKLYDNPMVFTGVVKIRKGMSCKLISRTTSLSEVHEVFSNFAGRIQTSITRNGDPTNTRTLEACSKIKELTHQRASRQRRSRVTRLLLSTSLLGAAYLFPKITGRNDSAVSIGRSSLLAAATLVYFSTPGQVKSNFMPAARLSKR